MHRILVIGMMHGVNGIATSVMNLYRNLDTSRYQWDFLLRNEYKKKRCYQQEIEERGGRVYYMHHTLQDIPRSSRRAFRELLLSIPDLQGVHVHDLGHNTYPLYCAKQLGLPIRATQYHSARSRTDTLALTDKRPFDGKLRLIAGPGFDRLACSDFAGRFAYGKLPFEIIPNGVDAERFSFNPLYRMLLRRQMGIDEKAPVMGFLGTVYKIKNPLFALRVFRAFKNLRPDAQMVFVGGGEMLQETREYAARLHLKRSVHFLGVQTEADMFFSAIDLMLCPSLSEGLPNAMVEAQAAGLPCLISDEVTDMVRITPLATLLSLKDSPMSWAEKACGILDAAGPRRSWKREIKAAGYDIRDVASWLMDRYDQRIRESGK